jgi:hypothetical protein
VATDRSTARRVRVVVAWTASYDPALKVARGERVAPGRTDPENPGWRWCVNGEGLGGWLPEGIVADGRVSEDFDTRELTVSIGDAVEVLQTCAGWSLCAGPDGAVGWIPDSCIASAG